MQPQVRYVKSSDGTRIAISTIGEGRPVVMVPSTATISIEGLWEIPEVRQNIERLAEERSVSCLLPRVGRQIVDGANNVERFR